MSLGYPFPTILEMTVECSRCKAEEKLLLPESIPMEELKNHLCDKCKALAISEAADDKIDFSAFYACIFSESKILYPLVVAKQWWAEYIDQNLHGKAISVYDFIQQLNLNDGKG